jgi:hypothetical protein
LKFNTITARVTVIFNMVNKVLLVLHSLLALAASSDIWTALYSAEECIATALIDDAIVASGACVSGQLSDGTTVSGFTTLPPLVYYLTTSLPTLLHSLITSLA